MAQLHTIRHRGLAFICALLFFVLSFQTLASHKANAWHTQNIQYLNAAEIKIEKITFETADLNSDGVLNPQIKVLNTDNARAVELLNTYLANLLQNGAALWKDSDSFDLTTEWLLPGCRGSKIQANEITELWVNIPGLGCIDVIDNGQDLQPQGLSADNLRAVKSIQFRWVNSKTIVSIDGTETFTQTEDANFPDRFFNIDDTTRFLDVNRSDLSKATARTGQYPHYVNDGSLIFTVENVDKADDPAQFNPDGTVVVTGADGAPTQEVSCESNDTTGLGWISCAIIRAIDKTLDTINDQVDAIMKINTDQLNTDDGIKGAWKNIRNISSVLLVLFALIMVASTALNFGAFDAYTIRKLLPRLAAAVILMIVSWPLMMLLIEITNDVGSGLESFMLAPFGGAGAVTSLASVLSQSAAGNGTGFFNAVAAGTIITGGLALGILGLISLAFTTLLGVIIGFVVLVLRNIVIVSALVLAPFAIICYILPGTEKIGKFWWDAFSKGLLMYPIIMLLFTSGRIFAYITGNSQAAANGTLGDPIQFFIVIAAYVIPYFLIPATFKLAGGAVATLGGMVNDRSKGIFDRNKKYRGKKMAENSAKMKNFSRFSDNNAFGRTMNTALGSGYNAKALRRGRAGLRAARQTGRAAFGADTFKNDAYIQAHGQDDNFLLALADEDLAMQKIKDEQATFMAEDAKSRDASLSVADREKAKEKAKQARFNIDARTKGLNAARQVQNRKQGSVRLAAVNALAKTGYQLGAGEKGYNQLSSMVRSIVGTDEGAYSAAMDEAQYHLKGAGRFDLAGINHGAGYDPLTGTDKASLYELGNAKKESVVAWVETETQKAGPAGHDTAVMYKELQAMLPNTKGAVRDKVLESMEALELKGVKAYMGAPSGRVDPTGAPVQTFERYDAVRGATDTAYAANFSATEQAAGGRMRAETRGDVAETQARTYEKPDPNRIT